MSASSNQQQAWVASMAIGRQHFQSGHMRRAADAFSRATRLQPERTEGWVNLGSTLLQAGKAEDAVAALGRASELQPRLATTQMLLGDAFRQLGDFDIALHSYRKAVALQRSPLALNKLACALRVVAQHEEAEQLYREAIALQPDFSLARVNLATLLIERGQFATADAALRDLKGSALPPPEQEEVRCARQSLAEYFRLAPALDALRTADNTAPLQAAIAHTPRAALEVDDTALARIQRYLDQVPGETGRMPRVEGTPPEQWPLIESLFLIPLANSLPEYLALSADIESGRVVAGELRKSLNMRPAIEAARACRDDMGEPVRAECHLRHWHALACRDLAGFLPGHFKYTQDWTTMSPTPRRVQPARAAGTLRRFIADVYRAVEPGPARAALAFIALIDLHPFADGNGRLALTWLNRELEWAGLMPALFSRELGMQGALADALKATHRDSDLGPLIALIARAQSHAQAFCTELAAQR